MNNNIPGKASIVILTHNNLDYTRQCLESIFVKTQYPEYEIIVVDNASSDGTPQYLEEIKLEKENTQILFNKQNVGFARGNNQGAEASSGEYLVFLNNDTIVTHGWLTRLVEHLQNPSIGMIGPVTNSASNEAKISVSYESIDELDQFAQEYTQEHFGETREIRSLAFYCVALRSDTFQQIGSLDERFRLGMFEDDDYALRMRQSGYKIICAEDVYIHHWGGVSFLKLDPYQYWLVFKENRRKFEEKWKIIWRPHLQRTELLPDQVIQLSEWAYSLKWKLLAESQSERSDDSFDVIVNRMIEQEQENDELRINLNELRNTLEVIYKSKGWRFIELLKDFRRKLFPEGSTRAEFFYRFVGLINVRQNQSPPSSSSQMPDQTPAPITQGMSTQSMVDVSSKEIAILAPQFFDYRGKSVYIGGAERYLIELTKILRDLGHEPVVYQSAIGEWERDYQGIPFIGLNSHGDLGKLNVLFHNRVNEDVPVIYLVFNLAAPYHNQRSVGISHGVFWDHHNHKYTDERERSFNHLLAPLSNLLRIVSVDTNTINWLRTVKPSLADKCVYIPNFVDVDKFKPGEIKDREQLVVLYPRRLYTPRGFWLVNELVPEFLEAYPQLIFKFVGQADPKERSAVKQLVKKSHGRVSWQTLEMQNMYQAYRQVDITLIPTVHSEGTSLSCLEAMASGSAVIATNIGGLPDLVIPGYNGLLIEPTVDALREALVMLCDNPDMRQQFGTRAREVAETFNIHIWQDKWRGILKEVVT